VVSVEREERLGRYVGGLYAGDEIDGFGFRLLPDPVLAALARAADPDDLANARPLIFDTRGGRGKHIDATALDTAMGLGIAAIETGEGGKPADRRPLR
jgi:hypothetical protein